MKNYIKAAVAATGFAAMAFGASAQQANPLTGQPMQGQQQAAPAVPADTALIKTVGLAELKALAVSQGHEVTLEDEGGGSPFIAAKDPTSGLVYAMYGTACEAGQCNGIEMAATWGATPYNSDLARLNEWNLSKAAVSLALQTNNDGSKSVLVSRYLILDFGQTFENLKLNLLVFTSVASGLGQEFTADPSQRTTTPSTGGNFQQ